MADNRVTLVSYAVQSKGPVLSGLMLDNGPALHASHLLNNGFLPTIFDYNTIGTIRRISEVGKEQFVGQCIEELSDQIARTQTKLVGFKLYMNGFRDCVKIAAALKQRFSNLRIVGGGPQVEWFGDAIYDYANKTHGSKVFDALVYGDADVALVGLAKAAYGQEPGNIPNLILKNGKVTKTPRQYQDISKLPFPTYDPEIYKGIEGKILIPVVEDSRSCGNACTFCVHPRIGGVRRERDLDDLLAEIDHMQNGLGTRVFRLSGPKPTAKYVNELCKNLPEGMKFSAFGYADQSYDFDVVARHLIGLFCGLESTDPKILEKMYCKTRNTEAYLANAKVMITEFKRRGLSTITSLIVPSPNETKRTMDRTLEFMNELRPDFAPVISICPIPGTPLSRKAMKNPEDAGIRLGDDFVYDLMLYELDLLQPPQNWSKPPFEVRYEGRFTSNPFAEVTAGFVQELNRMGIHILSDEQVLMAHCHDGVLSPDQDARRKQCLQVNADGRSAIAKGDADELSKIVSKINKNNSKIAQPT